jgi:hypothetical protein
MRLLIKWKDSLTKILTQSSQNLIPSSKNYIQNFKILNKNSKIWNPSSTNMNESCKNVVNNGGETLHTPHKKIDTKFYGFFYQNHTHSFNCTKKNCEFWNCLNSLSFQWNSTKID